MDESSAARGSKFGEKGLAVQVDELRGVIDRQAKMIESQAKVVESLSERLERMEGGDAPSTPSNREQATIESSSLPEVEPDGPVACDRPEPDRRAMLRTLGLAGAAVAAGTASAVASAAPAAAADGAPLLIGSENVQDQSDTTMLLYGPATPPGDGNVMTVSDINLSLGSSFPSSLAGYAFGKVNNGLYGYTNVPSGKGIVGVADGTNAASVGVYGLSAGTGVVGDNIATSGATKGVYGTTTSSAGSGVVGEAKSADGGTGVVGRATSTTSSTTGVSGMVASPTGTGVYGEASATTGTTFGVYGVGFSPDGVAVEGDALASTGSTFGVKGVAVSALGHAVHGVNTNAGGTGVYGTSGVGVEANSPRTQLRLSGTPAAPLGAGLARTAGDVVFDANKDLWLCVASGTPGTWRRISGPSTAGAFVPLAAPVRVYDSRPGFNPATGPKTKLTPSTPRTVDCTLNGSGVPVGASGVLVNLVATGTSASGDMAIYKDGIPYPGTSNVNFSGQTVAVTTFSALSTTGKVAVRSNVAPDVVLDVLGYYQ